MNSKLPVLDSRTKKKRYFSFFSLLYSLPFLWFFVFFILPLSLLWLYSFGEKANILDIDITWTLSNYARSFEYIYVYIIIKSVFISGVSTLICLLFGYPVALGIALAPKKWKLILLIAIVLPFWINILIRTYSLIALLRSNGYANNVYEFFWVIINNFSVFLGLGNLTESGTFEPLAILYNNVGVVIGIVYVFFPFMVLPLFVNIDKINKSYLEASLDLGANHWQTFFHVLMPLTKQGIYSGIILVFIPSLGAFFIPTLLGGTESEMIGNVIERQFKSANDWAFGSALSFLLLYVTFIIIAARSWLSRDYK